MSRECPEGGRGGGRGVYNQDLHFDRPTFLTCYPLYLQVAAAVVVVVHQEAEVVLESIPQTTVSTIRNLLMTTSK